MTTYLDTSLLVAALVPESASNRVHRWLEAQDAGTLAISGWTITEFASALAIKVRIGDLTLEQRADAQAAWTILRTASLTTLLVNELHFVVAAAYVDRPDLGLRSGDALHLAVASANGCSIATLDALQAKAAPACGVPFIRV